MSECPRYLEQVALSLHSEKAEITAFGGKHPMTVSGIQEVNEALNVWFNASVEVFVGDNLQCQSCAGGVVIDPVELQQYMDQCGVADRGVITYYALSHERTHFAQMVEAGGPGPFGTQYSADASAQLLELEADFVAGLFLGKRLLEQDIDFLRLPPFAEVIGNSDWPRGYHPAPEQRVQAIMRGLNVGAAWIQQEIEVPCLEARTMGQQLARHLQGGLRASGFYRV